MCTDLSAPLCVLNPSARAPGEAPGFTTKPTLSRQPSLTSHTVCSRRPSTLHPFIALLQNWTPNQLSGFPFIPWSFESRYYMTHSVSQYPATGRHAELINVSFPWTHNSYESHPQLVSPANYLMRVYYYKALKDESLGRIWIGINPWTLSKLC